MAFGVLAFGVLAFGVWRLVSGVWCLVFQRRGWYLAQDTCIAVGGVRADDSPMHQDNHDLPAKNRLGDDRADVAVEECRGEAVVVVVVVSRTCAVSQRWREASRQAGRHACRQAVDPEYYQGRYHQHHHYWHCYYRHNYNHQQQFHHHHHLHTVIN